MVGRTAAFLYGLVCYLLFLFTFLYAIGFVGDLVVPKSVDSGAQGPVGESLLIDALLLSLFAVQHSVMARPWFKRAWTSIVPRVVERSTYVLLASLVLLLLFWQWRPLGGIAWDVHAAPGRAVLMGLFWIGWAIVLVATYLIDHFELFGLRQVYLHLRGQPQTWHAFATPAFYRFVRHPLYLGFIIAFWSIPHMTLGHLVFAAVCTAYILVAIQFEERDLVRTFGEQYAAYRRKVPMVLPWRWSGK